MSDRSTGGMRTYWDDRARLNAARYVDTTVNYDNSARPTARMGDPVRAHALVRHVGNASGDAAYGRRPMATYLQNTYHFYRRHHGPVSLAAFRALNVAGCARLYVQHRLRRDDAQAAFWTDHVRAHVTIAPEGDGLP